MGAGTTDLNITPSLLRHIEEYIGAFKEGAGPDVEIALDLNFNFKPLAARQICQACWSRWTCCGSRSICTTRRPWPR